MTIPFYIIEAYGIYYFLNILKSRLKIITIVFFSFILLINVFYFFHMYFVHSPSHLPLYRNDGNEKLFNYLRQEESKYDALYLSSYEDLVMYYYYFSEKRDTFLSVSIDQYKKNITVGKYHFVPRDCPEKILQKDDMKKKILIVNNPSCKFDINEFKLVSEIIRRDSTQAYTIISNK